MFAGYDRNGNGDPVSDRPEGVSRNSGQLPNSFNVDLRIARTIPVGPVALEATFEVFNLLNRENVLQVNDVRYKNEQHDPNPRVRNPEPRGRSPPHPVRSESLVLGSPGESLGHQALPIGCPNQARREGRGRRPRR